MTSSVLFSNQDAPATPAAGKQLLYANTDNVMYVLDENGVATPVGAQNEFANTVIVNSADDLPDELTGGNDVVYEIQCVNLDTGTRTFTATGGTCSIIGNARFASRITSTASSVDLITVTDCLFSMERLQVDAPDVDYIINMSAPGAGIITLVLTDFVVFDCRSIARMEDVFVTSLRTVSVLATSVGGFDWVGACNQLNIEKCAGFGSPFGWFGSLFNLGTATFNIILISNDNRLSSSSANSNVVLDGMASSGNVNSGGRALVSSSIFNGDGTTFNNIDPQDLQWEFKDNVFTEASLSNTKTDADVFIGTQFDVVIGSSGVYVAMDDGSTLWSSDIDNRFTVGTDGEITYDGLDDMDIEVLATTTLEKVGGGADEMATKIAINGVVQDKSISSTDNSSPTTVVSHGLFNISNGDTIQIYVANLDSTSNARISNSNMTIKT